MTRSTYELQGYTLVLDHVALITRVFEAEGGEGYQFNVRFVADIRLSPRFPTREEAELARGLLVQAVRER
ncbi:MAG: hypothetical protein V2I57_05035 [Xanthomonadales bacterium]|jgi:hypothetical protein|nr:hypothetical protein [Xanthomonadales bacterium]